MSGGYKETEIGVLPEEWEVKTIGDCYSIQQGKALSQRHKIGDDQYPFLRTSNVFWGFLDLTTLDAMNFSEKERDRLALEYGDLLICEGGEIGRTAIWNNEVTNCFLQNHVFRVRAITDLVFPLFHMYWLQAGIKVLGLYQGQGNKTTIPNLSKQRLSSFQIPVPPLPEQKAIAHILRSVQTAREATTAIIEATRELKRSLMAHLFTYGVVSPDEAENVALKETEVGAVPEEWGVVRLGAIADLKNGINFKKEERGSGISTLDVKNMYTSTIYPDLSNLYRISSKVSDAFLLQVNDLLFVRSSVKQEGVGWTTLYEGNIEPTTFCGFLIRARLKSDNVSPQYLVNYLRTANSRREIVARGLKMAITNISQDSLSTLPIAFPAIREQETIASILQSIDAKIEAEQAREATLGELFRTLLHDLMTGRVRVFLDHTPQPEE